MADDTSGNDRSNGGSKGGLVKSLFAGTATAAAGCGLCPYHLVLAGTAFGLGTCSPPDSVVGTHEYLVDTVTPAVAYVRGDDKDYSRLPPYRMDRRTRELIHVDPNKGYAHTIVDWGVPTALGLGVLGLTMYFRRRRGGCTHEH